MGGEAETDLLLLMFIRLWTPPLLVGRTVRSLTVPHYTVGNEGDQKSSCDPPSVPLWSDVTYLALPCSWLGEEGPQSWESDWNLW